MTSSTEDVVAYLQQALPTLDETYSIEIRNLLEKEISRKTENDYKLNQLKLTLPELMRQRKDQASRVMDTTAHVPVVIDSLEQNMSTQQHNLNELIEILHPIAAKLLVLHQQKQFLKQLAAIHDQSENVLKRLSSDENNSVLEEFIQLTTIETDFDLLQTFLAKRIQFLAQKLRTNGTKQLSDLLQQMNWPHNTTKDWTIVSKTMTELIQVQKAIEKKKNNISQLWVIDCFVHPITQRFKYHFGGNRRTNRIDKPEWYFNYMLGILREQRYVIDNVIQVTLTQCQVGGCDAESRVLRGLMKTLMEKINMKEIVQNKVLFCHTIDEILAFERTIAQEFPNYTIWANQTDWPRCIELVFPFMENWVQVDFEFAMDRLEKVIVEPDAWTRLHSTIVTKASQAVVSILQVIKERFELLDLTAHRVLFLNNVQKRLIQRFSVEMSQMAKNLNIRKTIHHEAINWETFIGIINTSNHISDVLSEWGETIFYLEMQQEQQNVPKESSWSAVQSAIIPNAFKTEAAAVSDAVLGPTAMIGPTAVFSAAFSSVKQVVITSMSDDEEEEETPEESESEEEEDYLVYSAETTSVISEETVFEAEIIVLQNLQKAMIEAAAQGVWNAVKSDLTYYARNTRSWANIDTPDSSTIPVVMTVELERTIVLIRTILARATLGKQLLRLLYEKVFDLIDTFLFDNVISKTMFSSFGCIQLQHDIKMIQSTLEEELSSEIDTCCSRCTEATRLICQTPEMANDLLIALDHGLNPDLEALGIYILNRTEAQTILKQQF